MARYVSPDVQTVIDDPAPAETVRVSVVANGDLRERIRDHDGEFLQQLPSGVVVAPLPQSRLDTFCQTDDIETISLTDRMRPLA
jgi:hypothetical protein